MTKFAFEVPLGHLQDFEEDQDFYFVLSVLLKHERYKTFFLKQRRRGLKTLWLDNSYNETLCAGDANELTEAALVMQADMVIAPDATPWTATEILDGYLEVTKALPASKVVAVVASPQALQTLCTVGVQHYATPYRARETMTPYDLEMLKGGHYLGCVSLNELIRYRPPSCDTSMPIKLAMKGMTAEMWAEAGCPHIHTKDLGHHGNDFFTAEMTIQQIELAKRNIQAFKRAGGCA